MNIDITKIVTKEQRVDIKQKTEEQTAITARASRYRELTDPLLIEIIRKRFAADPEFAEINAIVAKIHEDIPIPDMGKQ